MPTTSKRKSKARKSRETDMLSDIENVDTLLCSNCREREQSEFSNSVRRPECPSYSALVNHDVNSHCNSREDEIKGCAGNVQNPREAYSSSEIKRFSGELNRKNAQEMNYLMCSVSSQIQRAINDAISEQVLPHIQATLRPDQDEFLIGGGTSRLEDRNADDVGNQSLSQHVLVYLFCLCTYFKLNRLLFKTQM